MKKHVLLAFGILASFPSFAQYKSSLNAQQWTDSVFNSLSNDEKIAQLIIIRAHSNLGPDHISKVVSEIQQYNVGALCFFQGGPIRQASLTNYYQGIAKTPLMITQDAEYGLGMRLDSVTKFPYQLTLGALSNSELVYQMGVAVGEQCKRLGVHVNYAPVVDINNNPLNPVIGYRSFGEDKIKVSDFGVAYMKGMQDAGIMACAKHFPGHGDVAVDSHLDLPIVNKSKEELDRLELTPFRALFKAGVGSVMIAHLAVPSIDKGVNRATSISKKSVTGLLRNDLGYQGLTFTDALEMKGVAKYFPSGMIAAEALIAGNDMLCLPADVAETIAAVKKSIRKKKIKWKDINAKVKKVLMAKYQLGLYESKPIDTNNLVADLNAKTDAIRQETAMRSIILLRNETSAFPLIPGKKVAYVGIGAKVMNEFARRMATDLNADTFLFSYLDTSVKRENILSAVTAGKYESVVIGVHEFSLRPAANYGISPEALNLYAQLQGFNSVTFVFGNVLATSNFCQAKNLVICHQDDDITQSVAADILQGRIAAMGTLPVSVCNFRYGEGIVHGGIRMPSAEVKPREDVQDQERVSHNNKQLDIIDSIALDGIRQKAFPGCVVMALHKGSILYYKAFGNYEYGASPPVKMESIFDLASVTKISATTIAVMKLYEEGRLNIRKTLGDYLSIVRGTNKARLKIDDVLLHQAGLVSFIPFYVETISKDGVPNPTMYSNVPRQGYTVRVAKDLYLRNNWQDTIMKRILQSPIGPPNRYVYSDNDFVFLGKIIEAISGMSLDEYVWKNFYKRMGMATTGFKPLQRFSAEKIVPTEYEKVFRRQLLQGDVHDPGAALLGGVAGHAGLFSNAYDLAMLYQMLLNNGEFNGQRYLQPETIKFFTSYHSSVSRRGLGFDKPEKDNATRPEPYPSLQASPQTFGHTGYTGTCVWVDPQRELVYIFLSNRVYPTSDNPKLVQLNIRSKIQDAIYRAIGF
jgi:beta-N-acetylhexosaminidase